MFGSSFEDSSRADSMEFVEGGGLGGTVDGPVEGDETGGESGFGRLGGFGFEFESDGGELGAMLFKLVVSGRREVNGEYR